MDQRKERVPAETLTITIPPFTTSEHPFFHEDNVTVKVVCESDLYGFELSKDGCMKRVCVLGFKKDGKGTKGRKSKWEGRQGWPPGGWTGPPEAPGGWRC